MKNIDPQIEAKKRRMQMDILIREGDFKKNEHKKIEFEIELKDLKRKKVQLEMEITKKELELKKLTVSQVQLFNDIKKSKNALNQM